MVFNILDEWRVSSSLPTPLAKQLADNIRWSISTGKVKPGEKLPPLRDLAQELHLSVNTIRIAYKMLEDQQLVVTRPHHGTHVIDFSTKLSYHPGKEEDNSLQLLTQTVNALIRNGISLDSIREMFDTICEKISQNQNKARVLFVECSRFECRVMGGQLADKLNLHVDYALIDTLQDSITQKSIAIESYTAVVTTYFHYSMVIESIRPFEIPVLGMVVEMPLETESCINAMQPGQKAGIICLPEHSLQYLINLIKSKRSDLEVLTVFSTADHDEIAAMINKADALFVTPSVELDLAAFCVSKPVNLFVDHINSQSIEMLRQFLQNKLYC